MVPPRMDNPQFKVNISYGSASEDYINRAFTSLNIKRRVNGYDTVSLVCGNPDSGFYKYQAKNLDEVKIYFKDASAVSWTQAFGGYIRQANPALVNNINNLTLNCKGYGSTLEETHCKRDYGAESSNPSLDTVKTIVEDIIDNFVEKSLGSADATNHSFTNKVADFASANPIKYLNNPYRTCMEAIDEVCKLGSAISAGAAGPEYIVDHSKNVILNTIGAHENPELWPDWVNYTQTDSTYVEGVDFTSCVVTDKSDEFANKILLVTDFRKPAYDSYTEGGVALGFWSKDGTTCIDENGGVGIPDPVVGTQYVVIENAEAWLPAAENAAWDIEKWGSVKTIPRLNFYMYKNDLVNANCQIRLFTTDHNSDYFYCALSTLADPDDEWIYKSIPIGPYWATADEQRQYRWSESGNPDWATINGLCFYAVDNGVDPGFLCLDDLHFSGKIVRSAKNSLSITANKEYQKVLISREAVDDSAAETDDSGYAARIAYAELLRRQKLPYTITFQISLSPQITPGQKVHVHAFKLADGSFSTDATFRILEVEHNWGANATTTVTATTDLTNSFPISVPDQYAIAVENLLVNSAEAKNMRATNEVDLLIAPLEKDYPT